MTVLSAQSIRMRVEATALQKKLVANGQLGIAKEKPASTAFVIDPWIAISKQTLGMSYGLSSCGYDIRVGKLDRWRDLAKTESFQSWNTEPGEFLMCSSLEYFELPYDIVGIVHDKSTLARKGLALQNTVLEPGWRGWITLEVSNHGPSVVRIQVGQPIAQVVFHKLDEPTELPYIGKYQDQAGEPVHAILSESESEGDQ